jgi:hypothetical protein
LRARHQAIGSRHRRYDLGFSWQSWRSARFLCRSEISRLQGFPEKRSRRTILRGTAATLASDLGFVDCEVPRPTGQQEGRRHRAQVAGKVYNHPKHMKKEKRVVLDGITAELRRTCRRAGECRRSQDSARGVISENVITG